MAPRGLLTMALLGGCSSPAPDPPPEIDAPALASEVAQEFGVGDRAAVIRVPASWRPVSGEDRRRLLAAAGSDPSAKIELHAFRPPGGVGKGMLQVTRVRFVDVSGHYGWTVEDAASGYVAAISGSSVDSRRVTGAVELDIRGRDTQTKLRIWAEPDGTMEQIGCICIAAGCEAMSTCALADPPRDALPPDVPIFGSDPPQRIEIMAGRARVDAPPSFARVPEVDLQPSTAAAGHLAVVERTVMIEPVDVAQPAVLGLQHSSCLSSAAKCSVEQLGRSLRSVPGVNERRVERDAVTYTEFTRRAADRWMRKAVWQSAGELHAATCDCSGAACPLAERTCVLPSDE